MRTKFNLKNNIWIIPLGWAMVAAIIDGAFNLSFKTVVDIDAGTLSEINAACHPDGIRDIQLITTSEWQSSATEIIATCNGGLKIYRSKPQPE